jgi:hypothetical protein
VEGWESGSVKGQKSGRVEERKGRKAEPRFGFGVHHVGFVPSQLEEVEPTHQIERVHLVWCLRIRV